MKSLHKLASIITVAAMFGSIALTASAAWTIPTAAPTGGNVSAPINTGNTSQVKSGPLGVTSLFFANAGIFGGLSSNVCQLTGIFCASAGNKGLGISATGDITIGDGTAPVAGRVLTQDASGIAKWGPGSANGSTLPEGYRDETLRNTSISGAHSATWFSDSFLKNSGSLVTIGSGSTIGTLVADIGGLVKIQGGSPGTGKILTSTDGQGIAAWGNTETNKVPDADDVVVVRRSYHNDGGTRIHEDYATCDPGYIAITGGVDCEPAGISPANPATYGHHDVSISEPSKGSTAYDYAAGTGNGTTSSSYPTGWHGACGNRNSNSTLDMHIMVVCMKVATVKTIGEVPSLVVAQPTCTDKMAQNYGGPLPCIYPAPATWHYATSVSAPTNINCGAALGTTTANVALMEWQSEDVFSNPGTATYVFNPPAVPTPSDQGECATTGAPYHNTETHLVNGQWTTEKTTPNYATYLNGADPTSYRKTRYYTLIKY